MLTALVFILVIMDVCLIAAVFLQNRRRSTNHNELIMEITEERRYLTELRSSIQEELDAAKGQSNEVLKKVSQLAMEAEQEVKSGSETIATQMQIVAERLESNFEEPLKELAKRQAGLEALYKRMQQEKDILARVIERAEKICQFFNKNVPYEDVLEEIQDKKYADARKLLAQGLKPDRVAKELGMTPSEVKLLADLG